MIIQNKGKKSINYRRWTRLFFRLSLIGLIVASCTQSVTWLGDIGMTSGRRYRPSYYNSDDTYYRQSNSTRYKPIDEIEDIPEEEVLYPDYNRTYTNGDY